MDFLSRVQKSPNGDVVSPGPPRRLAHAGHEANLPPHPLNTVARIAAGGCGRGERAAVIAAMGCIVGRRLPRTHRPGPLTRAERRTPAHYTTYWTHDFLLTGRFN